MSVGNNASFLSDVDGTDAHNMNEFRMKELLVSSMKINDRGVLYIRPLPSHFSMGVHQTRAFMHQSSLGVSTELLC
jgi:hypothetical protein